MQPTFEKKVIVYCLSIAILAGLTFVIGQILVENGNHVLGLSEQNNQPSIPHNAKGHESHQVIIFQNSSDGQNIQVWLHSVFQSPQMSFHLKRLQMDNL